MSADTPPVIPRLRDEITPTYKEPLTPTVKRALLALVIFFHVGGGWALTQVEPVKLVVGDIAPMEVRMVPAEQPAQPERWTLNFGGPNKVIQVEYWVGNKSVGVRTTENGFVATLTNLHKGTTMPVSWILLIDTLAGSLIFLSISGAILWWETHRRRLVGLAIFGVSVAVTVAIALSPLQW